MLVVNDVCKQIALGKNVQLRSSPSFLRDYIPISSVCEIMLDIIQNGKGKNEVLNISSGKSITLQELATLITERALHVLGSKPSIHFEQPAQDTLPLHILNEKLRSAGWNQSMDISSEVDALLQNCATWFTGSDLR
jgi:nucleoside-diphosphate-sugar epimerase